MRAGEKYKHKYFYYLQHCHICLNTTLKMIVSVLVFLIKTKLNVDLALWSHKVLDLFLSLFKGTCLRDLAGIRVLTELNPTN